MQVVQAVSARTGLEQAELPVLYDSSDPNALDAVIEGLDAGAIRFPYAGVTVTVQYDGSVNLSEDTDTRAEQGEDSTNAC